MYNPRTDPLIRVPPRLEIESRVGVFQKTIGDPAINIYPDHVEIVGDDKNWEYRLVADRHNFKWIGPQPQPNVVLHGGWNIHQPTLQEAIMLGGNSSLTRYLSNPDDNKIFFYYDWNLITAPVTDLPVETFDKIDDDEDEIIDNYQPQDQPGPADFAINATEMNSNYIQAAIQTARNLYPSFDLYIEAINHVYYNFMTEHEIRVQRSEFPSFLRDASPFEIYKVYTGPSVFKARRILNLVFWGKLWENKEHFKIDNDDIRGWIDEIDLFMEDHDYDCLYWGHIKQNVVGNVIDKNLTPDNFIANITPDQAILMEEWRKKVLSGPMSQHENIDLIDLKDMQDQVGASNLNMHNNDTKTEFGHPVEEIINGIRTPRSSVNGHFGFSVPMLKKAIKQANDRLPPYPTRPQSSNHMSREFVRYEGETAINSAGMAIGETKLPLNKSMPKVYYMMIYHELTIRGYMDGITINANELENNNQLVQLVEAETNPWDREPTIGTAYF
jgi:hypothetical protein